ncbi:MAG: hypothetical protein U9N84_06585 [Actinomycetota bacterium]|nr:hypothetical protein [Actinomycetota bacterium]
MSKKNPPLAGGSDGEAVRGGESTPTDEEKWPIGFMVAIVLVVLYLGWRLVQGVGWLIEKI